MISEFQIFGNTFSNLLTKQILKYMNITDFNEAIYASSNGVVVERRKNFIIPIIVLLAGVAMLVANYFIPEGTTTDNIKSALVLMGGLITIVGVAYSAMAIFGGGMPYHKGDKCMLIRRQYIFNRTQIDDVVKAVAQCDRVAVEKIGESDIAGVMVICYYSPKSDYCVMQAFAYEGFAYQSITSLAVKA